MLTLLLKRLYAFVIDYIVIIAYAFVLMLVVTAISSVSGFSLSSVGPVTRQIIGFFTMTLPVFLYFYFYEKGPKQATIGKRVVRLKVKAQTGDTTNTILMRNVLKLLPWELAHTGVHWMNQYNGENVPAWVWALLIIPQLVIVWYIISMITSKGTGSTYDNVAGTRIVVSS